MDTVKCAHCDGSGKEWAKVDLQTGQVQYRTCAVCHGTGQVPVERSHFTQYPDRSLEAAQDLIRQHGLPVEIAILGNHDIRVLFKNGARYVLGGFTVGYIGTGPRYTQAFLREAGFQVSLNEVAAMQPPVVFVAGQPYVPLEQHLAQAGSVEEAKTQAIAALPPNAQLISLEVTQDGSPQTLSGEGATREEALKNAKIGLPRVEGFDLGVREEVTQEGGEGTLTVQAGTEELAQQEARGRLPKDASIGAVTCTKPRSKGFLGIGQRPGSYTIGWMIPWKVQLTFQGPAAVRVRYRTPPR